MKQFLHRFFLRIAAFFGPLPEKKEEQPKVGVASLEDLFRAIAESGERKKKDKKVLKRIAIEEKDIKDLYIHIDMAKNEGRAGFFALWSWIESRYPDTQYGHWNINTAHITRPYLELLENDEADDMDFVAKEKKKNRPQLGVVSFDKKD